jgi:hypothetical protein
MNPKRVAIAAAEAKRFLKCVRAYEENPPTYDFMGNKETGALRRASMDLTRALADLRRPM